MKDDMEFELDSVRIEKIRVAGKHGVSALERQSYNTLEVTLEIWADLSKSTVTDELDDTINYSYLHKQILEVVRLTSFKLLERLGSQIISKLFEDTRIKAAMISISKPERLEGATPSVTLFRNSAAGKKSVGKKLEKSGSKKAKALKAKEVRAKHMHGGTAKISKAGKRSKRK